MNIITAYAVKNDCYKAARKMTPKGIVVHSTGANNPYLKRYVDAPAEVGVNKYGNHWNNSAAKMGRSVCVHSFIGYDINGAVRVANILPYDFCCWGVGSGKKGSYNYDPAYIQFEMCEDGLKDPTYFNAVKDAAIEYCVFLCKNYNIPVENIVSHKEAHALGYGSNHGDPDNWWKNHSYTMNMFRAAIAAKLAEQTPAEETKKDSAPLTANSFDVGEIVNFEGGKHYASSNAANGSAVKASLAKITSKNLSGKHPLHLRAVDKNGEYVSGVYGWVDIATIKKKDSAPLTANSFDVGEIVNFEGGKHYASSNAANGSAVKASLAKITSKNLSGKHPLHLRAVDKNGKYVSGVYGWVDIAAISKR